jgi:hypothetical protein
MKRACEAVVDMTCSVNNLGHCSVRPTAAVYLDTTAHVRLLFGIRVEIRPSVEQGVTIHDRYWFYWHRLCRCTRSQVVGAWKRCRTLIHVPIDAKPFIHCARHHTSSSEQCVVNGVGRNIGVTVLEVDVDHDEVMDMVQVVPNLILVKFSSSTSHDQVSARSIGNLVRHMGRHMELSVVPAEFELAQVSHTNFMLMQWLYLLA